MKTLLPVFTLLLSLGTASLLADNDATARDSNFVIGESSFPHGDSIEITSVEQSADKMVVKGHYNLVSRDSAQLALFETTTNTTPTPSTSDQVMIIKKGAGAFELTDHNLVGGGLPHVTMYSTLSGGPFGGVYFGNKQEAAEERKLNLGSHYAQTETDMSTEVVTASAPNQAFLQYLGNPVLTPAATDARYTAQGLTGAVLRAAQNAGIDIKNVVVDDSEFPPLVGVICGGSDFKKLQAQLRQIEGYEYNGGIGNDANADGSDTYNVFNLIPYRNYPAASSQTISHRLWLREQIFYDKIISQGQDLVPSRAQSKLPTATLHLGNQTLDAELALTQKQQITGMMFRKNIQETDSMLFVLSSPQRASFWMKNCPESLSAAYIGPDGAIEEIHHLEKDDATPVNATTDNVQFVLETKDGWFERHNIGVGTVISTSKGTLAQTFLPNLQ